MEAHGGVCTIADAGVDWLTCHVPHGRPAQHLAAWTNVLLRSAQREGNDIKPWRWNGYEGATAGQVTLGGRDDGMIVRLSKGTARDNWQHVYAIAGRCSRLDVQVTVNGVPPGHDLAQAGRDAVGGFTPRRGRPPEWTYVQTKASGATLYLGSRASQAFARLYDKGCEEGGEHLSGRWRYELELKQETAQHAASALSRGGSERARSIATVHEAFSSRGVEPVFARLDVPVPTTPPRTESDDARRLAWLSGQVRDVVAGLIRRGHGEEVLEALGLADAQLVVKDRERPAAPPRWNPAALRAVERLSGTPKAPAQPGEAP